MCILNDVVNSFALSSGDLGWLCTVNNIRSHYKILLSIAAETMKTAISSTLYNKTTTK